MTAARHTLELLNPTLDGLLTGPGLELLQQILPTWLPHQRWFGAKSRTIKTVSALDWARLPNIDAALVFLELTYENEDTGAAKDIYQLPLTITTGEEAENIRIAAPGSIIATLTTPPARPFCTMPWPAKISARHCWTSSRPTGKFQPNTDSSRVGKALPSRKSAALLHSRPGRDRQSNPTLPSSMAADSS